MGWDAHSSANYSNNKYNFKRSKAGKLFIAADNEVRQIAGSADFYLHLGGLDCSDCGKMLERAVGWDSFTELVFFRLRISWYAVNVIPYQLQFAAH